MTHFSPSRFLLAGSTIAAAVSLVACGGGGGGSDPAPPVATAGTLTVAMTDAPACGFEAVNVTVSKVRVNQSATASDSDAGWTDITLSPAKKINLLNLSNGVLEALGQTPLAAGHYNQLRLVLDANTSSTANTVVPTGSTSEQALDTPSAVTSGIKLNGQFDVAAGQRVDLVLDFDACKSVLTKGNGKYALKPVVKVVPTAINGIQGYVATALLGKHVIVSAQQNGAIVSATAPDASGQFFLSRLVPGNYDVVITADNSAAGVIGAVPVASTSSTTALSSATAPLTLAASTTGSIGGVVTLTPPSSTEAAYVSARQTFAAGPTVVIGYKGADLATGAYTIANLPVSAAQYVTYSATLPLTFTASAATGAGKYRVEAAATGYAVKAVDGVDIATQNQGAVNFTLTP